MLTYLLFPLGFLILVKGADALVEGSASIAKRLNVSNIVIGLTIVAFGTSAPELLINIMAAISGSNGIVLGNVIGSNISNILLILGITAVIYPLTVTTGTRWKEIPLSLLAVAAVFLMLNDHMINNNGDLSAITRVDGIILLFFFIIFLYYTFGIAQNQQEVGLEPEETKIHSFRTSTIYILFGILGLGLGGRWVVDGAIAIANAIGVSEGFIGLTLVALGTSAPELATSVTAAFKKNADIAIGNVVGSNIFNIFWVLAISAIIRPIPLNNTINQDIIFLGIATLLFFIFTLTGQKIKRALLPDETAHGLNKIEGIIFIIAYISYMIFLIYRG
jgi:cation:H+ antiporter